MTNVVAVNNKYVLLIISIIIAVMSSSSSRSTAVDDNKGHIFINCLSQNIPNLLYPKVFISMLTPYSKKLKNNMLTTSQVAIKVTMGLTKNLSSNVGRLLNDGVLPETLGSCKSSIDDAKARIRQSLRQIRNLGPNKMFALNSVLTWMSAAMTSVSDCEEAANSYAMLDSGSNKNDASFNSVVLNGTHNVTMFLSSSLAILNAISNTDWNQSLCI